MSDGRPDWSRVDAVLEEALDLPEAERDSFVQRRCAGEPELAREVRALLAAEARTRGFLEADGPRISAGVLHRLAQGPFLPGGVGPGDRVGRYRLVEVLGQGGMSVVYRARRDDGSFDQEVAVKLLRADGPPGELAERLRAERQILASLSHPGLAKVFDGGRTEDGRPYLVVELVDGEPLHRFAETDGLPLEERLSLFMQVARAVDYAHRNLVVHRDLKPSNILVTKDGQVKLLDFGIARILEGPGGSADATVAGPRWMTPRYAAPEQIMGRPVTTATDVHALGVLLYELLTGTAPFGDATSTRYEIEKAVCETQPRPPSSVSREDGPRPVKELDRDLDAIVLKALRKEPGLRYGSAAAMAEDVDRFLGGFPVSARGQALSYRARTFVRRHRLGVGVAALFLLTLVGGVTALALQQAETALQRDRASDAAALARQRADDAEAAIAFLADVFKGGDVDQAAGDTLTALGLVEWAEARVRTELADQPAVRAEVLGVLGRAYRNLGFGERGLPLLHEAVDATVEAHRDDADELAEALLALSEHHGVQRNPGAALPLARAALAILESPSRPSRPPLGLLTRALTGIGSSLRDQEMPDSAARYLERAVALERSAGMDDTEEHLRTLMALAYIRRGQGRLEEAEALYRAGIRRYRDVHPEPTSELALYLNNLAYTLRLREDYGAAESLYREAMAIVTDVLGRGHPRTLVAANNLGSVLVLTGRVDEADSLAAENLQAARALWPDDHWRVASAASSLGRLRLRQGDLAGAEPLLVESAAIFGRVLGRDHFWTMFAEGGVAALRVLQGRQDQGRPVLDGLHAQLLAWSEQGGGVRLPALRLQFEPFLTTLSATPGLEQEAARFQELWDTYAPPESS